MGDFKVEYETMEDPRHPEQHEEEDEDEDEDEYDEEDSEEEGEYEEDGHEEDDGPVQVVLTGFGPFAHFHENPSWQSASSLHNVLLTSPPPPLPPRTYYHSATLPASVYHFQPPSFPITQFKHRKPRNVAISAYQVPVSFKGVLEVVPEAVWGLEPCKNEQWDQEEERKQHERQRSRQEQAMQEAEARGELLGPCGPVAPAAAFGEDHARAGDPTPPSAPFPPPGFRFRKAPDLVIHVGVGHPSCIKLETSARRFGYSTIIPDMDGRDAPPEREPGPARTPEEEELSRETLVEVEAPGWSELFGKFRQKYEEALARGPAPGPGPVRRGFPGDEWDVTAGDKVDGEEGLTTTMDVEAMEAWLKEYMGATLLHQSSNAGRYMCEFLYFCSMACARKIARSKGQMDTQATPVLFVHVPPENDPYTITELTHILEAIIWGAVNEGFAGV